ncbi:MAG: amino acid ABC transporter substrate-binding protein [Actinobacteria bacterium]|nr:amino acid ABC transporter substrate-binding protein [Actinomycetota bacterium]
MSAQDAVLRLACLDAEAPPLFHKSPDGVTREGYEPAAAAVVAAAMGRRVEWVMVPWNDMIPSVQRHEADAVWCGQSIIPSRTEQVDFTRPYGVFNEALLVRKGSGITAPGALAGLRVGAIAGSTNMALAQTFPGAVTVPFGGESDDVFGEMLAALESGAVDGVVDDDLVFVPLGDDPRFEVAFTVRTQNRWGVGVAKDRPELREAIDAALATVIGDGRLEAVWREWLPGLDYPFGSE